MKNKEEKPYPKAKDYPEKLEAVDFSGSIDVDGETIYYEGVHRKWNPMKGYEDTAPKGKFYEARFWPCPKRTIAATWAKTIDDLEDNIRRSVVHGKWFEKFCDERKHLSSEEFTKELKDIIKKPD